jgi:hypothetical protein
MKCRQRIASGTFEVRKCTGVTGDVLVASDHARDPDGEAAFDGATDSAEGLVECADAAAHAIVRRTLAVEADDELP